MNQKYATHISVALDDIIGHHRNGDREEGRGRGRLRARSASGGATERQADITGTADQPPRPKRVRLFSYKKWRM